MKPKGRILVVDDETEIAEMLQRNFRYLGYDVAIAEHGVAALADLERNRTDIVISDIRMPQMDGVELLGEIRRQYPMIRVIMVTGYVTQDNVLACMRKGAETIIYKPLEDLEELENAVTRAMNIMQHWWDILRELRSMSPARARGDA